MVVETTNGMDRGTKGISLEGISKGKEPVGEKKAWLPSLEDGMEEPNIAVLGVIVEVEIINPP